MKSRNRQLILLAVVAPALIALWQWTTVRANFGGNWTALCCTGDARPLPPLVAREHVYVFPHSTGYDGEFYHYIAHDPWMRGDLKSYIDDARLRYRRILVPLLAYALALGRSNWIDPACEFLFLLSVAAGVYWSCGIAIQAGLNPSWGLLFLLMPAIPISMDRLVVDGTLAALTAGFLYYCRAPSSKLFCVLAAAALTRETGLLLPLAYVLYLALRREFRIAAIFAASIAPALGWYAYVQSRTPGGSYATSFVPLSAILRAFLHPMRYPAGTPLVTAVHAADELALAGAVFAIPLALFGWRVLDPPRVAAILFIALALVLQRADLWRDAYGFGRLFTPLFLCLAYAAARERKVWLLAPVLMIAPRIAIQFAPRMLGVIHLLRSS